MSPRATIVLEAGGGRSADCLRQHYLYLWNHLFRPPAFRDYGSRGSQRVYPTAEVRWFFQGAMAPAVLAWFRGSEGPAEEEPTRVDCYLRRVGDSLSIKLREGRVEVKQRYRRSGIVRFHPRVAGRVELWRKWSFEVIEIAGQPSAAEAVAAHWTAVEKSRTLHRYRLDGERVVAVAPAEVTDQGCDLELARIRVGGADWWSVGLEAYGAEPVLENTLLQVAGYLMAQPEPPSLAAENSYSYPEWLLHLEQETGQQPTWTPVTEGGER
jgi:hypothetical protein